MSSNAYEKIRVGLEKKRKVSSGRFPMFHRITPRALTPHVKAEVEVASLRSNLRNEAISQPILTNSGQIVKNLKVERTRTIYRI